MATNDDNPMFVNFLDTLKSEIAPNGASLQIAEDYKEAKAILDSRKLGYFQNKIIINELKNVLSDCRMESSGSTADSKICSLLQKGLGSAEAKYHLGLSHSLEKNGCNIFGLSEDKFNLNPNKLKETQMILQQYFTSEVEHRLKRKCISLVRFWDPKTEDESVGLAYAKATKLPFTIETEGKKISEEKKLLQKEIDKNNQLFTKYYEVICHSVDTLEQLVQQNPMDATVNDKKIIVDCVLQCQLIKDTYGKDTVSSLHKIRNVLETALAESKTELRTIRETLQVYESIGPDFVSIVKQYVKLTAEIDNKRWALSELKRTKDLNECS
eukprot:gene18655-20536_t